MASPSIPRRLRCSSPGQHLDPCAARDLDPCGCDCHTNGAFPPPCDVYLGGGGCGPNHRAAPDCRGCQPRQAAPDTLVCRPCEDRGRTALADLPDLYADLAEKPRIQRSRAEATEEMDDAAAAPMEAGRVDARHAIRRALLRAAAVLAAEHHLHVPDEAAAAHESREAYARHTTLASQARNLALMLEGSAVGPLTPDPVGAAYVRGEATRHLELAQAAWDDRSTGRDTVRALAVHVDRHLATLLAGPGATEILAALVAAHRFARAKANPSRDDRQRIVCACGAWVTLDAEETMTCRTCGAWGVLSWWVEQHAPAVTNEPMTAQGLLDWLLVRHGNSAVTLADLRQWAVRFPDKVVRRGRNTRGEQTYDPSADVVLLAEKKAARRLPQPQGASA